MKTAVRRLAILAAAVAVVGQTGCATDWKVGNTKDRMKAIRVVPMQNGAAVAVDPTSWDAFWESMRSAPVGTLGCVAVDAVITGGVGVGLYKFGEANGYWGKSSKGENAPAISPPPSVGHDNNQFVVSGSGNSFVFYPVTGAQ